MKMRKTVVMMLFFTFILSCSMRVFAEENGQKGSWDPEKVLDLVKVAVGEKMGNASFDNKIEVYSDGCISLLVDMDMTKDDMLKIKNDYKGTDIEKQFDDGWVDQLEGWETLSKGIYDLFVEMGFPDKCFSISVVGDVNDNQSDVLLMIVNGQVIYDLFK